MKKVIMILSLMVGLTTFVLAQGPGQMRTPQDRVKKNVEALNLKLNFTETQKEKVNAILIAQEKSMDSLKVEAGEDPDRKLLRPKMTAIMEVSDKQINSLLTDLQKKAYEAWKEERRSRIGVGRPDRNN